MHNDPQAGAAQQDNLLGVCAAIAEVSGLPALAVRLAFVAAMFVVSFQLVLATYAIAAVAIFLAERPALPLRLARGHG